MCRADPENPGQTVTDNATITAPDPPAGSTWWYSVTAILDGKTEMAPFFRTVG